MDVAGLNLKVNPAKLQEFESPDTSNAFFYNGKYNILGARQGKTSFNTTAYDARVMGVIPSRFGRARQWILAETDGSFRPITAPLANLNFPTYTPLAHLMDFGGEVSMSLAYAGVGDATAEWFSTFTSAIRAPMDNELFIVDFPKITVTGLGDGSSGGVVGPVFVIYIGIYKNGIGYYGNSGFNFVAAIPNAASNTTVINPSGTIYLSSSAGFDNTLTGLIDGLALKITTTWPPGLTSCSCALGEIFYAGVI